MYAYVELTETPTLPTRVNTTQEWERDRRHGKGTYWVKDAGKLRKQYAGDWKGGFSKRTNCLSTRICRGGRGRRLCIRA